MRCYFLFKRSPRMSGLSLALAGLLASCANVVAQEPVAQGLHDLVVYDPGAHDRGLPAPQFVESKDGLKVDIPPAVHIHRYYYSGDKEIQGPIINGGPTVVVATHPKTGERMYVDVVLPAGAPRIAYNKHSITYVYPNKRVSVCFQHFPKNPDKAVVTVHGGQGIGRKIHKAGEHVSEHVHEGLANSPMAQATKETAGETKDFLHGLKVSAGELSAKGADGLKAITNMIPGVTYIKSRAEQEPANDYASKIRGAAIKKERDESQFVPTNR